MKDMRNRYRQWRRYRSTFKVLNGLSDDILNDLGVGRGEIRGIARAHAAKRC